VTITENSDGMFSALLPNETRTYTFKAAYVGDDNHASTEGRCTVSVTAYYVPGAPTYPATAPDATCTRGQGVTFLYRALKGSAGATSSFVDIPANAFYADAVGWAVSGKVTDGTSNTMFSPDDNCTRGQIVIFLFRAYSK